MSSPAQQSFEPMKSLVKEVFDTTTPMIKEGAITRFTTVDIPKYAPWLIPKMTQRWPAISAMTFSGWVMSWTNCNTFFFVKNEHAVGMAEVYKQTPELRPKVREVFVFCETKDHEDYAVQIYKEFKRWSRSQGITEVKDVGQASDLSFTTLRNKCAAKTDSGLEFEL